MKNKSQLNIKPFFTYKIGCSISAIIALSTCLLWQAGAYGRWIDWIDLFEKGTDDELVIGIVAFVILVCSLFISVICSWINKPLISIIGFAVSILANTGGWLTIIGTDGAFGRIHLEIGAYLFVIFCSIGLIFVIKQYTKNVE